jgi:3-phosphoshikimate 1-carboxyvinyltransferase
LLSGLFSRAPTSVGEPLLSADHCERMLAAYGVPIRRMGSISGFDPGEWDGRLSVPESVTLPRDTTIGSAVAAIASVLPGSRIVLDGIGANPTRTGVLEALRLCGGRYLARAIGDTSTQEPLVRIVIEAASLRGGPIGGELPLHAGAAQLSLCMLALRAARASQLELRAFAAPQALWQDVLALLHAFGVQAELSGEALSIAPGATLKPARVAVGGDPQLAWLALSLAAAAEGESLVAELPELDEPWQALLGVLSQLGNHVRIEQEPAQFP